MAFLELTIYTVLLHFTVIGWKFNIILVLYLTYPTFISLVYQTIGVYIGNVCIDIIGARLFCFIVIYQHKAS